MEDKPLSSTSVSTSTNFSAETKHASIHPPQETKLPYCQHSESIPVSQAEQSLPEHLDIVLAQNDTKAIQETLETFIDQLQAGTLSQPAINRLANRCYRYWEQHLPTNQSVAEAIKAISHYKSQWQEQAKGRLLYREITSRAGMQQVRYYWSSTSNSQLPGKSGAFYLCYPTFDYPPTPAMAMLTSVEEIQEPALLNALTQYEQAEQLLRKREYISAQIVRFSTALQRVASAQDQQISDYCLAKLLLQRGYIETIPVRKEDAPKEKHAPFYAARLLSMQALERWRQPKSLESKTQHSEHPDSENLQIDTTALRNALDQALLQQARVAIFQAQYQICLAEIQAQQSDNHPLQLQAFYTSGQQVFQLVKDYPDIHPEQQQTLLNHLSEFLNEDDHDDRYRIAVRQALTTACRWPTVATAAYSIAQLTQAVTTFANAWHQHGKTALATAQLRFYRQILRESKNKLTQQEQAGAFTEDEAQRWYQATLHNLETALATTELTTQPAAPLSTSPLPASQWHSREEMLSVWHQTSERLLQQNASAAALYDENTRVAQQLMQSLCEEIEQQLGSAPTAFVILGLGSYSRGETSFASDLDFAILIADARAKGSAYFAAFLDCLAYKASGFPHGILPLEAKELRPMKIGECWVGTPEEFMEEHCYLPDSEKATGGLSDRSYPLLRPKPLYFSIQQSKAAEQLWLDYRQKLDNFFAQVDEDGRPYAHQTEPWYLQQHLKPDAALTLSSSTKAEKKEPTPTTLTLQKTNLKAALYPLTHAILSWSRYTGYSLSATVSSTHTATQAMLDHLAKVRFLPFLFVDALQSALADLHCWRLRLHWDGLQHSYPANLQEDEVWLWPTDPAAQRSLEKLPRGFYLNAAESQQLQTWRITLEGVILRSLQAFTELPFTAAEPPAPKLSPLAEEKISASFTLSFPTQKLGSSTAENKSTVPLTSTPQKVTFHPLAAAVEATLQQLNAPTRKNRSNAEEHAEAQWLAQVTTEQAFLLPFPGVRPVDPYLVNNDPILRRHWHVYWEFPQRWRPLYIETLKSSQQSIAKTTAQFLSNAPNHAGWRLRTQLMEKDWQASLRLLLAAEPQTSLPESAKAGINAGTAVWLNWVQGRTTVWAPLKSEYISQLLTDTATGKPKTWQPAEHKGGNHHAYCLKVKGVPNAWLKLYPEQPSTERIVTDLDRRLGCYGTPAQQLVAIHHAPILFKSAGANEIISHSAALLSAHVAGPEHELQTVLQKQPERLTQLDFLSFARTLLRVLLTNPEDDKGNDYFLTEIPESKSTTPRYQLIRIDNERAFFPATRLTTSKVLQKEELQVKSILYCLDQMLTPWSDDARTAALLDDLRQIQPAALVTDLLSDLTQLHPLWQQLFPKSTVKQHALCQDPWLSLPVLMVPEGLETTLLKRLTTLQVALRLLSPKTITGLKLLAIAQPQLARYYQKAFAAQQPNRDKPHTHVLARFDAVAGAYYRNTNKAGDYRTSQLSGPMLLSRQLSLALPELPQTPQDRESYLAFACAIHDQKAHSALQALENARHWQHVDAERVRKGLLQLKPEAAVQFGLLPSRMQQLVLTQLLEPQALARQPLSEAQQNFLLTVLIDTQVHNLDLTPFKSVITNKQLEAILKSTGQQIVALDISGCTHLTADILQTIQRYCPHLHQLCANQQVNWKSADFSDFLELIKLECEQATSLTHIKLKNLPRLQQLSIADAAALKELANKGLSITSSSKYWVLPKLQKLNIKDCGQLKKVQIKLDAPTTLECLGKSKDQLSLQSFSDTALSNKDEQKTEKQKDQKALKLVIRGATYRMGDYFGYWGSDGDYPVADPIGINGLGFNAIHSRKILIDDKNILLEVWAVGSLVNEDRHRELVKMYTKGAQGFLILLEIAPKEDFIKYAVKFVKYSREDNPDVPVILIGIESHLRQKSDRNHWEQHGECIAYEEAVELANQIDANTYLEYTHKEPLEKFNDIILQCAKMAHFAKNHANKEIATDSLATPLIKSNQSLEYKKNMLSSSSTTTSSTDTVIAPHAQFFPPAPTSVPQTTTQQISPAESKEEDLLKKARDLLSQAYPSAAAERNADYQAHALQLAELEKSKNSLTAKEIEILHSLCQTLESLLAGRSTTALRMVE